MHKEVNETFLDYLKGSAYWLGFKSPRWALFIAGIAGVSQGLSGFILIEVVCFGLLYYFYREERNSKKDSKPDEQK